MKKCVGFIVMVVLLTTMSTSVYAKDRISYGKAYSYPTNDLEQWRFIFIDKDPKWTKLKTIQGQPKNGTYLKSGDSLFYGENGGKKVDISFGVGLSAQYEGVSASVTFSIPMGKAYDTYYGKALKAHKDGYYVVVIKDNYDFIIIDCPPSLSMLTINAMTTADTVLVPIQCEYYALEGLSQLMKTIELVKSRLNERLEMEGVVFTMYDARTNLSLQVVENVKDNLNQTIYKTIIPRNIRLAEAPSHGLPINFYDPKSTGAESYMLLADEVIHKGEDE